MNRRLCGYVRYDHRYHEISTAGLYRIGAAGYFCKAKQEMRRSAYPAETNTATVAIPFLTTIKDLYTAFCNFVVYGAASVILYFIRKSI